MKVERDTGVDVKVGFATLDLLADILYGTGINSSRLIGFFNQYGLNKPQKNMLESKHRFARECLAEINGNPAMAECIKDILHPTFGLADRDGTLVKLNRALGYDGFRVEDDWDGLKIEPMVKSALSHLEEIRKRAAAIDHEWLQSEVRRIERSCDSDPTAAIGAARDMVESVCKSILDAFEEPHGTSEKLPALVKKACKRLQLAPEDVSEKARGIESIRLVLSNLGTIAQHVSELRNLYGSHGGSHDRRGLLPRHARLTIGAAGTLALFLLETYEEHKEQGGELT